jgi:hypothetical protein
VFSVGSAPRLYNEDARPAEVMIEGSRELVEDWQFSCEEKNCRSAAVKRKLYVCCSYSETYKSVARIRQVKTEKT